MATKDIDTIHTGEKLIVGGLFFQIFFFGIFVASAGLFHLRMHKNPTSRGQQAPWLRHMMALYGTSILILIRSIFRAIEFIQGNDGFLLRSEVFIYLFDATLMFSVMCIMNYVHPSEIRSLLKGGSWTRGFKIIRRYADWTEMSVGEGVTHPGHTPVKDC